MKLLLLMRHGDAPTSVLGDEKRCLNELGKTHAASAAEYLARKDSPVIDQILCSTSIRTRETFDILQSIHPSYAKIVTFEGAIYKTSSSTLMQLIQQVDDKCSSLLVIGHNPTLLDIALSYHDSIDNNRHYDKLISTGFQPASIVTISFPDAKKWRDTAHNKGCIIDIFSPYDL